MDWSHATAAAAGAAGADTPLNAPPINNDTAENSAKFAMYPGTQGSGETQRKGIL